MPLTAYITHPSFHAHEMGAGHPECAARLDAINDYLLTHGYLDLMPRYLAPEATREQLQRVIPHTMSPRWRHLYRLLATCSSIRTPA